MDTHRVYRTLHRGGARTGKFAAVLAVTALLGALAASTASAGKDPTGTCDWPPVSMPFAHWGDSNLYFLAGGGSFEGGAAGWTLSGGASIGTPNEPWNVNGASDNMSLGIPNGASATSSPICVTSKSPALRLFDVNTGGSDRPLQVFVNYTGTDGKAHSAKLQDQKATGSWGTSQQISFVGAIGDVLKQYRQTMVTFTFVSPYQNDRPGKWRIDDLYIDDIAGICNWPPVSMPFAQWGDNNPYFLASGGSFEGDMSGWTLSGAANVSAPNEPWNVNGSTDHLSLNIPNGASATSPPICVTVSSPALRLFYVNTGGSDRPLQIFLNYTGTDGKPHSAKLPDQKNSGSWTPSQPIMFLNAIQDILKKCGQTTVTFTFTVPSQQDRPANWRIDDVEIDPLKGH
jgi:hypothetical protein